MDERIVEILSAIASELSSIRQIIDHIQSSNVNGSGQIKDQIRSNSSSSSDQIRSDQISNNHSELIENFKDVCTDLGISLKNKDLYAGIRSISFFFSKPGILNQRSYILKMLENFPVLTSNVGFTCSDPGKVPSVSDPDSRLVFGIKPEIIDDNMRYMDRSMYLKTRVFIPNYKSLFNNWLQVSTNDFKLRVLTAYAINNGLIVPSDSFD